VPSRHLLEIDNETRIEAQLAADLFSHAEGVRVRTPGGTPRWVKERGSQASGPLPVMRIELDGVA